MACESWTPDGSTPQVAPGDPGFALQIAGATALVRIEDMSFEAAAGTEAARSSIAVFVGTSPSVVFRRVEMKAGPGAAKDPLEGGELQLAGRGRAAVAGHAALADERLDRVEVLVVVAAPPAEAVPRSPR